jgi:hypothetical protein
MAYVAVNSLIEAIISHCTIANVIPSFHLYLLRYGKWVFIALGVPGHQPA